MSKWETKVVRKDGRKWIELRNGDGVLVIITNGGGYDYKFYKAEPDRWGRSTVGTDIHLSMNDAQQWSYDQFDEFVLNVALARQQLDDIDAVVMAIGEAHA
jgi:hypothetical protein